MAKSSFLARQKPLIVNVIELNDNILGDYLVKTPIGHEQVISKKEFEKMFDLLSIEETKMYDCVYKP